MILYFIKNVTHFVGLGVDWQSISIIIMLVIIQSIFIVKALKIYKKFKNNDV